MADTPRKLIPIASRQQIMSLQQHGLHYSTPADFNELADEQSDDDFVDAPEDIADYDRREDLMGFARAQHRKSDDDDVNMQDVRGQQSEVEVIQPPEVYDNDIGELFPQLDQGQQPGDFEELGVFNYQPQTAGSPDTIPRLDFELPDPMEVESDGRDKAADVQAQSGADTDDLEVNMLGANFPIAADEEDDTSSDSDVEIVGQNEQVHAQSLEAQGYIFTKDRRETPPLPSTTKPEQSQIRPPHVIEGETYSVNKTSSSLATDRAAQLAPANSTTKPVVPRDLAPAIHSYQRLTVAATNLMPRLSNWNTMDWSRRYWIAILFTDSARKPLKKLNEKDFMWMKGNKNSTVKTVWHSYQMRTLASDFVLVCRGEICGMDMRAEELDWFGQKLVVFKALSEEVAREQAKGLSVGIGVVPREMAEVVELDDD